MADGVAPAAVDAPVEARGRLVVAVPPEEEELTIAGEWHA